MGLLDWLSLAISGYVRLILLCVCWAFFENFYVCFPLYTLSAFLDGKYIIVIVQVLMV